METTEPGRACHDVLLAMAGRVPDRALWRLRDWSAKGASEALRTAVPRALVRHRVGVTDTERSLLRTAVLGWSGSPRLVDAVLHLDETPTPVADFSGGGPRPGWDTLDLALRALAPASGASEVRRAWRRDGAPHPAGRVPAPVRVVLVRVESGEHADRGADPVVLTGALQNGLRALGEPDPRVEVMGPSAPRTAYHDAALASSELLWTAEERAGAPASPLRWASATGELVPHG